MRLIKIGNEIINLENVSNIKFYPQPNEPSIFIYLMSHYDPEDVGDCLDFKGDLALRIWEFLCREAIDVEVPTSNPWKD